MSTDKKSSKWNNLDPKSLKSRLQLFGCPQTLWMSANPPEAIASLLASKLGNNCTLFAIFGRTSGQIFEKIHKILF